MEKPKFQHDCDNCIFLGRYLYERTNTEYDLYYCSGEPTVVARYDNDGPNYMSGLLSGHTSLQSEPEYPLAVAYQRAVDKGYLHQELMKNNFIFS